MGSEPQAKAGPRDTGSLCDVLLKTPHLPNVRSQVLRRTKGSFQLLSSIAHTIEVHTERKVFTSQLGRAGGSLQASAALEILLSK